MLELQQKSRRLRHLVSETCRVQSALMSASQELVRQSARLLSSSLSVVARAGATPATSPSDTLSRIVAAHHEVMAEVLPTLGQILDVRRQFMRHRDRDTLINDILHATMRATSADLGNIQLFDSRKGVLQIVAQQGFSAEFLDFFGEVRGDESACGVAMCGLKQVIVEDVVTHPIFVGQPAQDILLRAGVRAVQSTPLITTSGELVGMVSTHFRARHRVPAYRLRLLEIIGRQIAALVRDSRR